MEKTKNKNGEGSIFQTSENKWIAKIYLGKRPDGKPKIKQFSGKTKAVVKKKLKEFKNTLEPLEKPLCTTETVKTYFTKWLKEYQYNKLKPLSYDRLESTVINHIIPNIGSLQLDQVTRDNVQSLINMLYNTKKLSYSSVKKVYLALNSCYKHALIEDTVIKNPCIGVVLPSQSERSKEVVAFSPNQVEKLKDLILNGDGCFYGDAYLLILNTGLRMGEALALRWDDIDLSNRTITVKKNTIMTKKRNEQGDNLGGYEAQVQMTTKTFKGNRIIPINRTAEEALMRLKCNNSSDYVIVNSRQNKVLPSNFDRSFHLILNKLGLPICGVHTLRHTFASMLFSRAVDIKIISKLLGHSSVKITYDTYVHLFDMDVERVTWVLD